MSLLITLGIVAGFGLGWIACHYFVVRYLIWTVRDMRQAGFLPPDRETPIPTERFLGPNET